MSKPKKVVTQKKQLPIEKKLDALQEKVNTDKYMLQKYVAGTSVSIPGTMFADIINLHDKSVQILNETLKNIDLLRKGLGVVEQLAEIAIQNHDKLIVSLMEQHIKNVDAGLTEPITREELQNLAEEPKEEENGNAE
jgi:hypothetical protein